MAHKDRIQLICQGSHRIVILSEGKLAAVIGGRFIAVGNCMLYRLLGDFFTDTPSVYVGEGNFPRVMQDGRDGDEEVGYIEPLMLPVPLHTMLSLLQKCHLHSPGSKY